MPKFDAQKHRRRSIRLKGYDYASAGGYYVTIVAWRRECLFGEVVNKEMVLNKIGKIVEWEWLELPKRLPYVTVGAHMVMPNHFHGILFIHENVRATQHGQIISQSGSKPLPIIAADGIGGSPFPPPGPQTASPFAILSQIQSRATKSHLKIPRFQATT